MSWHDDKTAVQQEITDLLTKITALNAEDLARTAELGKKLSYESGVPLFKAIIDFFRRFGQAKISFLSLDLLNEVRNACQEVNNCFDNIRTVDLTDLGNPAAARDGHIAELDNAFGNRLTFLAPLIAASGHESLSLREKEKEVERLMAELHEKSSDAEEQKNAILTSMRSTLQEVQEAAAKVGVAKHAVHFDKEAKQYEESSTTWLRRTVGTAALALAVTAVFAWHAWTASPDIGQTVQIAVSKIAILAVLYAGMLWSARIYRSERHNWTVNRHRCNALLSFETFVAASTDGATKNAVLLQATESIFGHQPSGFSDKAQESGAPKILEIFRGLSGRTPE